ncbi:hypothetical protein DP113_20250 [Brasilonema octagenarum UFV-E1]|jgi:hypothetical protein|uniref:Uncharacterized protein n=1 Tax=Brasilonema sennae CENA114 TaxID=415709 RepID=A0A856MLW0_9CYAN|nr:hypothetical protein DP114_20325 [Brasilonema sennae CENA114]QDL16268.1 hypothetical protein DP113_20250 [Brasilonema octagenarum UFV-E1]
MYHAQYTFVPRNLSKTLPLLFALVFLSFVYLARSQELLEVSRLLHSIFTPQFSVPVDEFQQKISSNLKNQLLFSEYK